MPTAADIIWGRTSPELNSAYTSEDVLVAWQAPDERGRAVSLYVDAFWTAIDVGGVAWPIDTLEVALRTSAGATGLVERQLHVPLFGLAIYGAFREVRLSVRVRTDVPPGSQAAMRVAAGLVEGVSGALPRMPSAWDDDNPAAYDDIVIPPYARTLQIDDPDPANGALVQPYYQREPSKTMVAVPNSTALPATVWDEPKPLNLYATHYRVTPGAAAGRRLNLSWGFE